MTLSKRTAARPTPNISYSSAVDADPFTLGLHAPSTHDAMQQDTKNKASSAFKLAHNFK
jgi:hypothetical protein